MWQLFQLVFFRRCSWTAFSLWSTFGICIIIDTLQYPGFSFLDLSLSLSLFAYWAIIMQTFPYLCIGLLYVYGTLSHIIFLASKKKMKWKYFPAWFFLYAQYLINRRNKMVKWNHWRTLMIHFSFHDLSTPYTKRTIESS